MKSNIVKLLRPAQGYGRSQIPQTTYYAIRRTKRYGFCWIKKKYQYLKLRDMEKPEWKTREELTNTDFWGYYADDNPETILEKWKFTPKSKEEVEREKYGVPINPKMLETNLEEIVEDEMNDSRIDRLGIDTTNDTHRQAQQTGRQRTGIRI